jgi:hypothetical protein
LLRDPEHPAALAFLARTLARDLTALNTEALDLSVPVLSDDELLALEDEATAAERARQTLAGQLRSVASAAGTLSDRLSMRHFAHISLNTQALAT